MVEKISDNVGYVNKVLDNVSCIVPLEFREFYESVRDADAIILTGAGRSGGSLRSAFSEFSKIRYDVDVMTPGDVGFRAATIYGAAPILEKKYNKIALIANSGSGKAESSPYSNTKQLARYIENTGSKKFSINVITSNVDSPLGRIGSKHGATLCLKGRDKSSSSENNKDFGIMGDIYELGSLAALQGVCQMMCEKVPKGSDGSYYQRFDEIMKDEFPKIGKVMDEFVSSDKYAPIIDNIESRSYTFMGGRAVAEEISKMLATRVGHLKHFLGDEVHIVAKATTPRPRARDLAIFTSYSGGNPDYPGETEDEKASVVEWAKNFNDSGVENFSMVGNKNTKLEGVSKSCFHIFEEIKPNKPNWFYVKAAYAQSPIAVSVCERLATKRGLKLSPGVLEWFHSIAE
ncbi:MAG: hypothetical protein V1678_05105 [Candidatus Aenigmatarchaeota archaeon]